MANELAVGGIPTGQTTVCQIRRASDEQIWSVTGTAFEAYNQSHQTTGNYDVVLTEQGTSGYYVASMPAGITSSDSYNVVFLVRSGSSPSYTYVFETGGSFFFDPGNVGGSIDGLNWTDLGTVKTFLSVTDTSLDALINQLLPQASVLGNQYVDRTIKSTNMVEVLRGGWGQGWLKLSAYPVSSVTTVTFDYLGNNEQDVDGSNFYVNPVGTIQWVPSATGKLPFSGLTQVSYVGGYTSVPADLVLAVCLIIQRMIQIADPQVLVTYKSNKDQTVKYDAISQQTNWIPEQAQQILERYKEQVLI